MEETNKAVVFRLVNQVFNGGNLDVIEDLYAPCVAAEARAWITPFRESFTDVHVDILQLIAEGDRVVGHFTCTATLRTRGSATHQPADDSSTLPR
jgi:SnoaL-like protein